MAVMTVMPRGRGFIYDDLQAMPDDGNRYEIIDGALIVSPSPVTRHQVVIAELNQILRVASPSKLRVLFAPYDVKLAVDTVVQPDLLVAARTSFGEKFLPGPPLLAVEVLSPSTRRIDLTLKRSRFEDAGVRSYWVVDPAVPSIIAWELVEGAYVEAGRAEGDEVLVLDLPFGVRIVPRDLLDE